LAAGWRLCGRHSRCEESFLAVEVAQAKRFVDIEVALQCTCREPLPLANAGYCS
jgi:hypothetical protein